MKLKKIIIITYLKLMLHSYSRNLKIARIGTKIREIFKCKKGSPGKIEMAMKKTC